MALVTLVLVHPRSTQIQLDTQPVGFPSLLLGRFGNMSPASMRPACRRGFATDDGVRALRFSRDSPRYDRAAIAGWVLIAGCSGAHPCGGRRRCRCRANAAWTSAPAEVAATAGEAVSHSKDAPARLSGIRGRTSTGASVVAAFPVRAPRARNSIPWLLRDAARHAHRERIQRRLSSDLSHAARHLIATPLADPTRRLRRS